MNTPTTQEINAALDPLIERIAAAHPDSMVTIDRRRYTCGTTSWCAYASGTGDVEADDLESAVSLLIVKAADRKGKIRAELERLNAELARLEKGDA